MTETDWAELEPLPDPALAELRDDPLLGLGLHPPDWTVQAACAGMATAAAEDPWHPPEQWRPKDQRAAYERARAVCAACPVQVECTRYALLMLNATGAVEGMFGGLTPAELKKLARTIARPNRKIAMHGSRSAYVGSGGRPPCRCDLCRAASAAYEHARRLGAPGPA